jgi:hypothetical protein
MATSTGAFFLGVGTTSAILAVGFGGGLMMAKTAMQPRAEVQARASQETAPPVRVILPASSEPAQPPQPTAPPAATTEQVAPSPAPSPAKEASGAEQAVENVERRKAEAEERDRHNRAAQRKARRLAERAKRQLQIEQSGPPMMAFDGDDPPHRPSFGFFGND